MKWFSTMRRGAYQIHLNLQASIKILAHHIVVYIVKHQNTCEIDKESVDIIENNIGKIRYVKKKDADKEIQKRSSIGNFRQF